MNKASSYVITISRQLGSGGASLGLRLAMRLNALYLNHEIIRQAAQELKIPEEHLAYRDEKVTSNWQTILRSIAGSPTWSYAPPPLDIINDAELFNVESDIITRIANQRTAVIVGRGGCYVLRRHLRCLTVFLHASIEFRQQRVQELYHVPAKQALKLIDSTDKERARYFRTLTGQDWLDARQYHLSLDTSAVGLDKAEAIILETLQARFNDIECRSQGVIRD